MSSQGDQAQVQAEMLALLKGMTESMTAMTTRLTSLEERVQTIPSTHAQPLGTHFEFGNGSNESTREPLEDQATAFRQARRGFGRDGRVPRDIPIQTRHEDNQARIPDHRRQTHREEIPRPPSPNANDFNDEEFQNFNDHGDEEDDEWRPLQQRGFPLRRRAQEQYGVGRIKIKIPSFEGKVDANVYVDWEAIE